jgi:hypothetical protein
MAFSPVSYAEQTISVAIPAHRPWTQPYTAASSKSKPRWTGGFNGVNWPLENLTQKVKFAKSRDRSDAAWGG